MMNKIREYFTVERRLLFSVIIGWGLVLFLVIIPILLSNVSPQLSEFATFGLLITAVYLCIRYSTFGPVLKASGGGFTVIAGASILDILFSRRSNQGSLTMGAFVGAMLVILAVLVWNTIKALYYLIRETITLFQNYEYIKEEIKNKTAA